MTKAVWHMAMLEAAATTEHSVKIKKLGANAIISDIANAIIGATLKTHWRP